MIVTKIRLVTGVSGVPQTAPLHKPYTDTRSYYFEFTRVVERTAHGGEHLRLGAMMRRLRYNDVCRVGWSSCDNTKNLMRRLSGS
jgi:hypothetical protein